MERRGDVDMLIWLVEQLLGSLDTTTLRGDILGMAGGQ